MKDQDLPTKLVELLPSHLKVKKLSSELKEELSPGCIDKVCLLDQNGEACDFIKRYHDIICSTEFSEALMRLYKYQQDIRKIPEEVQNDLRRLERNVTVACMQTIEVRLLVTATGEALPGSESEVSTFFHRSPDGFCIRIKHGGETNPSVLHANLSSFIAKVTGQHIVEANWQYLMMILDVKDSSEISKTLDDARVPRTVGNSTQRNLGDIIPEHFHDLLKNDVNYNLREGEIVGYEIREDDENDDAVYIYAKIIEKTIEGNFLTEIYVVFRPQYSVDCVTENVFMILGDGRFEFNSRYKIDIGRDEPIEVSKLKLYKFDRTGTERNTNEEVSSSTNQTMEVVLYEGFERSSRREYHFPQVSNAEEAKREVAEASKEIWQLPESERSSAIKRLIRQWHPTKIKIARP